MHSDVLMHLYTIRHKFFKVSSLLRIFFNSNDNDVINF